MYYNKKATNTTYALISYYFCKKRGSVMCKTEIIFFYSTILLILLNTENNVSHDVKITSIDNLDDISCYKQHSIVDLFHMINQFR